MKLKIIIIVIVIVIFTINKFQKILQDPILLGLASEPKANGSCGGPNSHGSYVQGIKGLASVPNALGSVTQPKDWCLLPSAGVSK